jgi:hypothetical protein
MGKFALAYGDQVERDYADLKAAARNGEACFAVVGGKSKMGWHSAANEIIASL